MAMNKKRILVIEDEAHIAEGLRLNLDLQGYEVSIAKDGVSGLRLWKTWGPDLIVLDIMLPGIDGFSVLQNIRLEDERIPVLILSARSAPDDRIQGLSCGVDDYMTKPFHLEEFLLRIERLLTRKSWYRSEGAREPDRGPGIPADFRFGANRIDFSTLTAETRNGEIRLTDQEARLLKLFIANRGKPLSRKTLLEIGWGYTGSTSSRTVDNFVMRLRKYFEKNPKKPQFFKSLRSVGYIFDPP